MSKNTGRPIIVTLHAKLNVVRNNVIVHGLCLVKIVGNRHALASNIAAVIHDQTYPISFTFTHGIRLVRQYRLNHFTITIPLDKILAADIQNKIRLVNTTNSRAGRMVFNPIDGKRGHQRHSQLRFVDGTAIYLRQSVANTVYLTVRQQSYLDSRQATAKILLARVAALATPPKNIILLFEKERERYQESAAVLYEKLRHLGYDNVYYIINQSADDYSNIPDDLRDNVVQKHSFKHLYYFFKCKKFIGTETLGHAIQLRCANRLVLHKEQKRNLQYVFLQHGVMYMVSLNSALRSGFRSESNPYKLYRIVVSSKADAQHFIELGGCDKFNLYITGLPKFDKAYANPDADKIVIMPTWRRWEANQASSDYERTKYYQLIRRIVKATPKDLQNKLIILPHPLIAKELKANRRYAKYLPGESFSYDQILRDCRLLITDYSSIAYDAFYRGANVIFDWSEKDECMAQYGPDTFLLLNERNAFGDVVYRENASLSKSIANLYQAKQPAEYLRRYRQIVEFHDNHNTDRLIEKLKEDKVI